MCETENFGGQAHSGFWALTKSLTVLMNAMKLGVESELISTDSSKEPPTSTPAIRINMFIIVYNMYNDV